MAHVYLALADFYASLLRWLIATDHDHGDAGVAPGPKPRYSKRR